MDVNYSLIAAVRDGSLERARQLIDSFGLSYSPAWSEGYVLLCDALENKQGEVAKLLLTSGSKVNSKNKKPSDTALHFAVTNGDIEIVKMILDRGAYIDAINQHGRTPLHTAIENEKVEVTKLLLNHGANFNARDYDGESSLQIAVDKRRLEIIEYFLKFGVYTNCVYSSTWGTGKLLHFAVEKSSKAVTTLLLNRGDDVDVKGTDNITPLHIAAMKGDICIVEDLLNHGACIHSLTLKKGYTPLHFASELGKKEAVQLFLHRGADINANTKSNLTPLHIAIKSGYMTVVRLLLEEGAKVDNQDKDGKTILYFAVQNGQLSIVKEVLKYCPDINNQSNRSSLKIAVHSYRAGCKKIVEALLEYGFAVKPEDANDPELLHAAVEKAYLKIVEDLLKYGADVNALHNSTGKGFTPLHSAAKKKQEEVAKLLISYEADINAQDKTGKSPIFYAIENADLKLTKLFLTNGANVKDSPELLHMAVKKECIEIIEALLQHDADINASNKYGMTALHFTALSLNNYLFGFNPYKDSDPNMNIKGEIAKLLLSKGANVNSQTKNGVTTLYAAIQNGYAKVVEALLEHNANVNSGIKSDITPLQHSVHRGNEEISAMFLNKGTDINAKQKNGVTALHVATEKGHKEVVKVLLEYGAKVDSKMVNGITPLHLGSLKGHTEIIEIILKFGADINSRDEDGRTALHIASQEGHTEVVATLLEYGSDINITDLKNCTPLDYAMNRSYYDPFYDEMYDSDDADCYHDHHGGGISSHEIITNALKRHIVKMKIANLYVSENNLESMSYEISDFFLNDFHDECKEEIASMKSEKINNANISFYDILAKGTSSSAIYLKNENIMQVLKSGDYKTKFPIYASMIESHFRKGMERKELLEQGNKISHLLFNKFPELPYHCIEKIFTYLSGEDFRNLMDACKPLSISNPNANSNDVATTSNIS